MFQTKRRYCFQTGSSKCSSLRTIAIERCEAPRPAASDAGSPGSRKKMAYVTTVTAKTSTTAHRTRLRRKRHIPVPRFLVRTLRLRIRLPQGAAVSDDQAVTVVAVSTHLDDVVLSCFGALGPKATVVTVLAGVPAD